MGAISFPMLAINCDASRTMSHASVIQTVKQIFQLPKKVHKDVTAAQLLTHVMNSSRCEEHIINPLQHRKEYIHAVKTEDNIKSIGGSQRMKSGSTKASDQCLPLGR
jgi:hypothetical protein